MRTNWRMRVIGLGLAIVLLAGAAVWIGLNRGGVAEMADEKEQGVAGTTEKGQSVANALNEREPAVTDMEESAGAATDGKAVKVNQVGYPAGGAKIAVVEKAGEAEPAGTFRLIDEHTGAAVYSGSLSFGELDAASAQRVWHADFSAHKTPGSYRLEAAGIGRSFAFEIGERMYAEELATLLRSYTLQRSGVDIEDPVSVASVPAGHLQDAEAVVYFDDGISRKGDLIDASGGWYDAGDFGKYISPAAVTVAQLLLAYELSPEAFSEGQLRFPAGLEADWSGVPDILAEVRFELEWILKMQRGDGAVYHKISGASWPGFVMPHTDTQTRYAFGLSTFSTAQFAGATALAARIYEPYDAEFASRLLNAAELAHSYLEAEPAFGFRQDAGQDNGSGSYGKSSDAEERLWAAAELFRTTGQPHYEEAARRHEAVLARPSSPITWMDAGLLGQWAYYHAEGGDAALKERIASALLESADEAVERAAADGYLSVLKLSDYHWASAKLAAAYGCMLLLAHQLQSAPDYERVALEQLHYVFGRTATGYSYVTGVGEKHPLHPHHRTIAASGVMFPGLVVGGPNRNGGDPDLDAVKAGLPPAKAYLDVLGSYSSNEYAIDYNAPVVMLAAYFAART